MLDKRKVIVVTGACGSIGSNLTKRLLEMGCEVRAFDQSEDGLFHLDQNLKNKNLKLFLGTIREQDRLDRAFENADIVFHCAALKHVYLSEYNPFEAMKSNIDGVNNVINSAIKNNVRKVIFTSSDKAVNPSSTMGATKLLGERLITTANHFSGKHKTKFSSVRFGNVFDTNGSVVQIFKKQISEDKPLTITSPDMTRFFISMKHAIDLCLYAEEHMIGGEIFVKSMGSFLIKDLAYVLSNKNDNTRIIGCKPGEKLYEELVTETESTRTITVDDYYVLIPETIFMMDDQVKERYEKLIDGKSFIGSAIRSDQEILDHVSIEKFLNHKI